MVAAVGITVTALSEVSGLALRLVHRDRLQKLHHSKGNMFGKTLPLE